MADRRNILIVSENLLRGGLETRVLTQSRALVAAGCRVHFATSSSTVPAPLEAIASSVHPGLSLGAAATAFECAEASRQLAKLIAEKEIGLVHAHPFASLLPGAMAAALAQVPMLVTLHGASSFLGGPNYDVTLFDFVLPYASEIHVVSEELGSFVPQALAPRRSVMPNSVDLTLFPPVKRVESGPWAVFSRLEDGKEQAILEFLRMGRQLGFSKVHIFGGGQSEARFQEAIAAEGLGELVELHPWCDDPAAQLAQGYAGVAGMGRVVLEAVAMRLPCVLLGYEEVHGVVTPANLDELAWSNFSGRGIPAASLDVVRRGLAQVSDEMLTDLRSLMVEKHDEARLVTRHLRSIDSASINEEARARLLQVVSLMRRTRQRHAHPWFVDPDLQSTLALILRRPTEPELQRRIGESLSYAQGALGSRVDESRAALEASVARTAGQQQEELAQMRARMLALEEQVGALSAELRTLTETTATLTRSVEASQSQGLRHRLRETLARWRP
ncbi:glycosyltransferase family 4 protein [Archangium lansingense]|uniref:Glycosyltransferase family 4 protein n=1 Tax=Archangium lansingense TaxID=2995310 RepID=A0ABT4AKF9_9BACT|nr:glycosyltransferase family 4 protein [Archangium lansinium]MCY1082061.1 glycosyltransferase family 4 protein [Archangium lansinium]